MRGALRCALLPAAVLVLGSTATKPVQANTIHYLHIFTTNGGFADHPGVLLTLETWQQGELACFEFSNESTIDLAVAGVFFEQGPLTAFDSLLEGPGTQFSWPASQEDLPGGNTLIPPFDTWFSAGAEPPPSESGINPGESVTFLFEMSEGITVREIGYQLANGDVRVGAHVIGFPDGSSESAVTAPEPSTGLLLLAGLYLTWSPRRRNAEAV